MKTDVFELGPEFKIHALEVRGVEVLVVQHVETDAMVVVPQNEIRTRLGYLDMLRRRDRPADVLRYFVRRTLQAYAAGRLPRLA